MIGVGWGLGARVGTGGVRERGQGGVGDVVGWVWVGVGS